MMDGSGWVGAQAGRDRGGRFAPGVSGNPAGKRKGTRNRMTILKMALDADESGAIARVVIDRALAGDSVAARFYLGLLMPKARSRPIELDLPECNNIDGIVAAFDVTVAAMAAGEITPDEALTVSRVLDRRRRALAARVRQQAREAKRVAAATTETPAESSGISAAETPAPALPPAIAQVEPDLHFACNFSSRGSGFAETAKFSSESPAGGPDEPTEAMGAPPRRPLPEFGSACMRPALRRRMSRSARPIRTGPSDMDGVPDAPLGVAMTA